MEPAINCRGLRKSFGSTYAVDGAALTGAIAVLAAADLRALQSHPPTLEDLFLRHYSEARR